MTSDVEYILHCVLLSSRHAMCPTAPVTRCELESCLEPVFYLCYSHIQASTERLIVYLRLIEAMEAGL